MTFSVKALRYIAVLLLSEIFLSSEHERPLATLRKEKRDILLDEILDISSEQGRLPSKALRWRMHDTLADMIQAAGKQVQELLEVRPWSEVNQVQETNWKQSNLPEAHGARQRRQLVSLGHFRAGANSGAAVGANLGAGTGAAGAQAGAAVGANLGAGTGAAGAQAGAAVGANLGAGTGAARAQAGAAAVVGGQYVPVAQRPAEEIEEEIEELEEEEEELELEPDQVPLATVPSPTVADLTSGATTVASPEPFASRLGNFLGGAAARVGSRWRDRLGPFGRRLASKAAKFGRNIWNAFKKARGFGGDVWRAGRDQYRRRGGPRIMSD